MAKKEKITTIRPDTEELEPMFDERPDMGLYFMFGLFILISIGLILRMAGII
jgi:hypothetical protein